jgi:uncharacterized protein (DUF2461 family)
MTITIARFEGWPADATAFLAGIAADNTAEFWAANRHRHTASVLAPLQALAAELRCEFGELRIFRPHRNRRFRPDADPYRTDAGGVATSAGGTPFAVLLSAAGLSVEVGHYAFDSARLRRYRESVDGPPGAELERLLAELEADHALVAVPDRRLTGAPRGVPATHPRIDLLRHRAMLVARSWPAGEWLGTPEPLHRVRDAWRAARPLAAWLEAHVGPL